MKINSRQKNCMSKLVFPVALMAHRGGSSEWIENTLPAFRSAAKLDVDILEMDCQMTR